VTARSRWFAPLVVLLLPAAAQAGTTDRTINDYYIDFGVPDLTALTVIGANSSRVLRPGTMKELATGFLGVAGEGGDINPGLAVEWTPVRPRESLRQYRDSRLKYVQAAFGTAKDGDLTDFGFGVRWNVLDRSDPLGNRAYHGRLLAVFDDHVRESDKRDNELRQEFARAAGSHAVGLADRLVTKGSRTRSEADRIADDLAEKIWDPGNPPEPLFVELVYHRAGVYYRDKGLFDLGPDVDGRVRELARYYVETVEHINRLRQTGTKALEKALAGVRNDFKKHSWNAPVLTVGGGWVARSADSSWRGLRGDRISGFAGCGFPLGTRMQGLVQLEGRVAAREEVDERSFWGAGGRVIAVFDDRRVSAEGYYSSADNRMDELDEVLWRVSVGLEMKFTKGVWFEVAIGGEFDNNSDDSTILLLGNVKYGVRKQPRFDVDG
jgi:hypothetical protein